MRFLIPCLLFPLLLTSSPAALYATDESAEISIEVCQGREGDCAHAKWAAVAQINEEEIKKTEALFKLARLYQTGHGVALNHKKALDLYERVLEIDPDFKGAWLRIGQLYEHGHHGLRKNYEKARHAYQKSASKHENAEAIFSLYRMGWDGQIDVSHEQIRAWQRQSAELGHPIGAYSAGHHYFHGTRDPKDREKAIYFFELAHKNGKEDAAHDAAWFLENATDGGKPDYIEAARFYKMATEVESPRPYDFINLGRMGNQPGVKEHYGEETIAEWKEQRRQITAPTKDQAAKDVLEAKALFDQNSPEDAALLLKERFDDWSDRFDYYWNWEYMGRIWWEAQTKTGASDLEWGRFLFAWLADEIFARPYAFVKNRRTEPDNRIGVRTNLCGRLISLGRFGLLRARTAEIKDHIRHFDGLEVDRIVDRHSVDKEYNVISPERLPIHPKAHSKRFYKRSRPDNDILAAYTVEAMEPLSQEALSLGNWEAALIYAAWIERWIDHIESTGQVPQSTYGGYHGDIKEMPWALRARVFVALGLPDRAAEQYQASIDAGITAYRSRALHRSYFNFANYLVDHDRAAEVDMEKLKEVETAMSENKFAERHEWQFAKLAQARVLAATESFASGQAMVDEVLAFTETNALPLLRLEALLVAADMHMDIAAYDGIEGWLSEALKWAREKGLLFEELRIYQQYVRYLIATGQYETALDMQRRVMELIDSLNLEPRRPYALLRLAEIYALIGDAEQARTLLARVSRPEFEETILGIEASIRENETINQQEQQINLQPLRIVTEPLVKDFSSVFILSNFSPSTTEARLVLSSTNLGIERTELSSDSLIVELTEGSGFEQDVSAFIPGMNQLPIILQASNLNLGTEPVRVKIELRESHASPSEWVVQKGESLVDVSVIDAALIKENPFYLIPVFHHISSRAVSGEKTALRAVASHPTRIECFNAAGRLLFVDAEGNGSFEDPGDLVATKEVDGLDPVIALEEGDQLLEMRYQPIDRSESTRVEVKLETRSPGATTTWQTNVIDWLER